MNHHRNLITLQLQHSLNEIKKQPVMWETLFFGRHILDSKWFHWTTWWSPFTIFPTSGTYGVSKLLLILGKKIDTGKCSTWFIDIPKNNSREIIISATSWFTESKLVRLAINSRFFFCDFRLWKRACLRIYTFWKRQFAGKSSAADSLILVWHCGINDAREPKLKNRNSVLHSLLADTKWTWPSPSLWAAIRPTNPSKWF